MANQTSCLTKSHWKIITDHISQSSEKSIRLDYELGKDIASLLGGERSKKAFWGTSKSYITQKY